MIYEQLNENFVFYVKFKDNEEQEEIITWLNDLNIRYQHIYYGSGDLGIIIVSDDKKEAMMLKLYLR